MRLKNSILLCFLLTFLFYGCEENVNENKKPEIALQTGESDEKIQEIRTPQTG